MHTKTLKTQRGAEVVEFLIVLPFMLLLFAVFVEFGIAFADKAVITEASYAAAREMIRCDSPTTTDDETCQEQARQAANAVLKSAILWTPTATGPYLCDTSHCPIVSDAGTGPGDPVTVTVTFPFRFRWLSTALFERTIGHFAPFDLSGQTSMRRALPN